MYTLGEMHWRMTPEEFEWEDYFRWPSKGREWSTAAWLLLIPKVALVLVFFAATIAVVMLVLAVPTTIAVLIAQAAGLPWQFAVIFVAAVVLATLYFFGDTLDY